jgi:methionine-rich copper-binding protein CopC
MSSRTSLRRIRVAGSLVAVLVALLAGPVAVMAHAELESATPADGAVLAAPPTEIVITYTEELDPSKSSLTLHDASGAEVASGGVDPDNDAAMRIDPPTLAPGTYEIRSTAVAAHDGAIDRETLTFTISEPTPAPTEAPTPTPSAAPSETPAATALPSAVPSPAPSADGTNASSTDVLVPILAAIVLVAVLGGWLLSRSRGRGPA